MYNFIRNNNQNRCWNPGLKSKNKFSNLPWRSPEL